MLHPHLAPLTLIAAVGSGIAGGVFFAFSSFVMRALNSLPPQHAIAAMQAINTEAPTRWFMASLFGTALSCTALGVLAFFSLDEPESVYQLVGSGLYLAGIVLTITYHVPRNLALARIDSSIADSASQWRRYTTGWTAWNHIRAITSIGAAATLGVALRVGAHAT